MSTVTIGLRAAIFVGLAACGGMTGGRGSGSPVVDMSPEDRVLLGDFSHIVAVASSREQLFVVSTDGLVFRDSFGKWQVPRSAPPGINLNGITSAVVDPFDQSLWLAGGTSILQYRPIFDEWNRGVLPGNVSELAVALSDPGSVWVRIGRSWFRHSTSGSTQQSAPPQDLRPATTLEDAYRDIIALRALGPTLATGPGLSSGRLTAAAPTPDRTGWVVGTDRQGAFFLDRMSTQPDWLGLGLPSRHVGAVELLDGALLVATDREPGGWPAALALVMPDLIPVTVVAGDDVMGLGVDAVREILTEGDSTWLGTERGLLLLNRGERAAHWGNELPDLRVTSIVRWGELLAVGTLRGVVTIDIAGQVDRLAEDDGVAVSDMVVHRDSLWLASNAGLLVAGLDGTIARSAGWRDLPGGLERVVAVGSVGDTLVAVGVSRVGVRDSSGLWAETPSLSGQLGRLLDGHVSSSGTWIAGEQGVGLLIPGVGLGWLLRIGTDLPDMVTDLASDGQFLWVATRSGLMRIRLAGF